MSATDGSIYSWALEASRKTLGADTPMTIMPFQTVDMDTDREFSPRGEARDDFFDSAEDFVARNGRISQTRKFLGEVFDHNFEQAMWSTFLRKTGRYNGYGSAVAQITNVDAASSTFTVTDESADFAPQQLVWASGFTNAANNGIHVATTSSDGTSLIVTGSTLVDETPPRGARLEVVGIAFAAGDLAISGDTLVSTAAVDYAALAGAAIGHWAKVGAGAERDSGAHRFATDLVNDAVRISSLTPTGTLTIDRKPAGWADDNGATKTIWVTFAEPLLPGATELTIQEQVALKKEVGFDITRLLGGYVEEIALAGEAQGDFVMTVAKVFLDFDDDAPVDLNNRANGPVREAETLPAMVAGLAGQRIYLDGVYKTEDAAVRTSNIVISPTLVDVAIEGCFGMKRKARSTQVMRLTGEAHFETDALSQPYRKSQKLDFVRIMHAGRHGYVIEMPKLQFLRFKKNAPGQSQAVTGTFESKATADDAGIAAGNFVNFGAIHRFRWAEGWPDLC